MITPGIGIFDSGIGGLTVVRAVEHRLPDERLVYFGDTARLPYGTKSERSIRQFALQNSLFLLEFTIKLLVVACNTASAVALDYLKTIFKIPVVSVIEPGAQAALQATKNGKIGVIGTTATITNGIYGRLLRSLIPSVDVVEIACPLFVPLIEEGILEGPIAELVVERYLQSFRSSGIDTLILGCTHYPLFRSTIAKFMGNSVILIDSAQATAEHIAHLFSSGIVEPNVEADNGRQFFVSDITPYFKKLAERFLGRNISEIIQVDINC